MTNGRRFHLRELLGSGSFGKVYLADQESGAGFRRRVVLKMLHPHLALESGGDLAAEARKRMRDEARLLGRLSHSNIVGVVDLVRLDDRWAVVMDYVPGVDLDRMANVLERQGQRMSPAAAIQVAVAVANALDAAWKADDGEGCPMKVVHRDIKPSNVLISVEGHVKVLDFGVARFEMEGREGSTNLRVGTDNYMAPERHARGSGLDGPEGDVYALGLLVCELLVGKPLGPQPVWREAHEPLIEGFVTEVRAALVAADTSPAVAEELVTLLARTLAFDVDERPTARELADRLSDRVRLLPGERLHRICADLVPTLLSEGREAADGMLSEAMTGEGRRSESTFLEPVHAPTLVPAPAPSRRVGVAVSALAGVAALGLLTVLGVGAVALSFGDAGSAEGVAAVDASVVSQVRVDPPSVEREPVPAMAPAAAEEAPPASGITGSPPASGAPRGHASAPAEVEPPVVHEPAEVDVADAIAQLEVAEVAPPEEEVALAEAEVVETTEHAGLVEPEPAPPPPRSPVLATSWAGSAGNGQLSLLIDGQQGAAVTARAVLSQGPSTRTIKLTGTVDPTGQIRLSSSKGARFTGRVAGSGIAGQWQLKEGARSQSWTVTAH
jgi:serine/threonine-protein kinase